MHTYYIAGFPYSDELYHYGILGQKWGVRRYQNKDGSLTAEGREHYGVKGTSDGNVRKAVASAGKAVGTIAKKTANSAKNAVSFAKKRFKMNHPSLMTDQELKDYTQRMIQERTYADLKRQVDSKSGFGRAKNFVGNVVERGAASLTNAASLKPVADILSKGANTLADAGFRKLAQEMTKSKLERENDKLSQRVRNKDLQESLSDDRRRIDNEIRDLEKKVRRKELTEKLSDEKESAIAKARRILGDSNASASQIKEAKNILIDLQAARKSGDSLFGDDKLSSSRASDFVDGLFSSPEESREFSREWGPRRSSLLSFGYPKTSSGFKDASSVFEGRKNKSDESADYSSDGRSGKYEWMSTKGISGYKDAFSVANRKKTIFDAPKMYVDSIVSASDNSEEERFRNWRMRPLDD